MCLFRVLIAKARSSAELNMLVIWNVPNSQDHPEVPVPPFLSFYLHTGATEVASSIELECAGVAASVNSHPKIAN